MFNTELKIKGFKMHRSLFRVHRLCGFIDKISNWTFFSCKSLKQFKPQCHCHFVIISKLYAHFFFLIFLLLAIPVFSFPTPPTDLHPPPVTAIAKVS